MIKTIFVPTSGTDTDEAVLATALAVARPLDAHLDCYHVRFSVGEAAARSPHVQYCVGAAMGDALQGLKEHDEKRAGVAIRHVKEFCKMNGIPMQSSPEDCAGVSAQHLGETDQAEARLLFHARHRDLTVLGRPHTHDLLVDNVIELLLMGSGRPVVIAPESSPTAVTGTIVVGWKETAEAARALGAAMPLLQRARRVILVTVAEESVTAEPLTHLAQLLKWHRVAVETRLLEPKSRKHSTAATLLDAAASLGAGLLVAGGYGRRPLREAVFGGVTQALIEHAQLPVFLMH